MRQPKGFTLIEIAIALVIIGLLIGLGVSLIGPLTKRVKLTETRDAVKTVYEAILGYVAANKKLPSDLSVLGVKTTDAYGRPLKYFRPDEFVSNNICTFTATYLTVNDSSSGTPQTKNNVAFIVFSEGENRTNDTGSASPFTILDQSDTYDDIVMYVDIDKLREQVCNPFRIVTDSLPVGTEEIPYPDTKLEATDGITPYLWSITTGSLPDGLTLGQDGTISGTPTKDGTYNFTVQVKDREERVATKSLSITINPNKPRITTEFLTYGTVSQPYPSTTLSATGGKPPYTWTCESSCGLPPGLSLSASEGTISGTPTTPGTYSFTVTVTDSRGRQASKTLSITINPSSSNTTCPALNLSPASGTSWNATSGQSFSQSISVSGGQPPLTNIQCTPSSCNGLSLSCSQAGATISGTPSTSGTCTFNVGWKDSCTNPGQQTVSGTYTVNILPSCAPFTGWASNLPSAEYCKSYSGSITVYGGVPSYAWNVTSGSLPSGINFCTGNTSATCTLSGNQVLASPGDHNFTVQVQDSCTNPGSQTTSKQFTINVVDLCQAGIVITNSTGSTTGSTIYYRIDGGDCTAWPNNANNATINVTPNQTINFFSTWGRCNSNQYSCQYTYCTLKGYDTNRNCLIRLSGITNDSCTLEDQ